MAFPVDPLDIEVAVVLDADLSADPGSWSFTDITDFVRENNKVVIRRGRTGNFSQVTASKCTLTVDNSDGRFSRHNPAGAYYGQIKKNTPLRVRVNNGSGYVNRFCGYVTGWPPEWDPSESDQTVPLSADGIMRRLGRDSTIKSAMFRSMSGIGPNDYVPFAYWSMEEGNDATQFAAATPDTLPLTIGGTVDSASESTLTGSSPLPTLSAGASLLATIPTYDATGQWVIQFLFQVPVEPVAASITLAEIFTTGGTIGRYLITLTPGADPTPSTIAVAAFYAATGAQASSANAPLDDDTFYGRWFSFALSGFVNGSSQLQYNLHFFDAIETSEGPYGNTEAGTVPGVVTSVKLFATEEMHFGHLAVFTDPSFDITDDVSAVAPAMYGHTGELAHVRVARLCQEAGVPVTITGDSSAAMGPQRTARVLDLLRDCATADQGILYEPLDFGLAYICGRHLYNQIPAITLQYDQGHVAPPFKPDDDDRDFYNDVTATRPNGSPIRVINAASVADVGSYPLPVTPHVETDDQAYQIAGWLAAVGSNDELKWPAVRPNLRRAPELIDAWMAADIGMNLSITGHPSPLAPDAIVQLILGYSEILGSYTFEPTITLSPATIYNSVGVWGLMGQELHAAINSSVTSADIATTSGPLLATSLGAGGYTAQINAEEIQITAVAASTITFGSTGTVAHANNANVTPGIPASVATGNLLLCFAAIRNSGTGVPNTPAGYTRLAVFGSSDNCQLFAKIATSGAEAAPTVSFTGGVAGADTSAQMIRLAGKWHSASNILLDSNTQLNASAQNINYPGLMVPMADDCIILVLGWKQDDWTSVTGPGTEIGEPDTTTGDDQGIAWYYTIQTTATAFGTGALAVTGGAAAISRSATLALRCDYQTVTIERSINGVSASHSAADAVTLADPSIWAL